MSWYIARSRNSTHVVYLVWGGSWNDSEAVAISYYIPIGRANRNGAIYPVELGRSFVLFMPEDFHIEEI